MPIKKVDLAYSSAHWSRPFRSNGEWAFFLIVLDKNGHLVLLDNKDRRWYKILKDSGDAALTQIKESYSILCVRLI